MPWRRSVLTRASSSDIDEISLAFDISGDSVHRAKLFQVQIQIVERYRDTELPLQLSDQIDEQQRIEQSAIHEIGIGFGDFDIETIEKDSSDCLGQRLDAL